MYMQLDLVLAEMREAMKGVSAEVTVLRRSVPAHPTKSSTGAAWITSEVYI